MERRRHSMLKGRKNLTLRRKLRKAKVHRLTCSLTLLPPQPTVEPWVRGRNAAQGTVAGALRSTRPSRALQHGSRKQWHIRADRSGKAVCTKCLDAKNIACWSQRYAQQEKWYACQGGFAPCVMSHHTLQRCINPTPCTLCTTVPAETAMPARSPLCWHPPPPVAAASATARPPPGCQAEPGRAWPPTPPPASTP